MADDYADEGAMRLAWEKQLMPNPPSFSPPKVTAVRKEFFQDGDLNAVLAGLSDDVRPLIQFLA